MIFFFKLAIYPLSGTHQQQSELGRLKINDEIDQESAEQRKLEVVILILNGFVIKLQSEGSMQMKLDLLYLCAHTRIASLC